MQIRTAFNGHTAAIPGQQLASVLIYKLSHNILILVHPAIPCAGKSSIYLPHSHSVEKTTDICPDTQTQSTYPDIDPAIPYSIPNNAGKLENVHVFVRTLLNSNI